MSKSSAVLVTHTSEYAPFAAQHEHLLEQFSVLLRFSHTFYDLLAMQAMASTMRRDVESASGAKVPSMSVILSEARELAVAAGIDKGAELRAVERYLKSATISARRLAKPKKVGRTRKGKSPSERIIDKRVSLRRMEIEDALKKIPPTVEKAQAALVYETLNSDDDGPPDALSAFGVEVGRYRFKKSVLRRRQNLLGGKAMTSSARGYEPYWYTSYLRYYETFEPKEARTMLLSEARNIEDELKEHVSAVNSSGEYAGDSLPHFLHLMFAYARCRTVRFALFPIARRTISAVLRWQRPSGAWCERVLPKGNNVSGRVIEDSDTTASAVMFLARYGSAEECKGAFPRAQRWLVDAQNEDGRWHCDPARGGGLPISTTVLVLEALKQTGIPADHPAVLRGEAFLLQNQQPPGLWWEKSGRWETHLTAQVLEYFQSRTERPGALNSFLKSARSLLLKSEQLTLSEDDADGPLATVAAYHGVEHFLYGCLLELDANESMKGMIYADTKGTTIGLNEAMGLFERTLRERGYLQANASLPHRQQLKHLGSKRDMFIHRAEGISAGDAFGYVATCRAFVERYDLVLLGFRLCE